MMNSTLKQVSSQSSGGVQNQMNKPMHPQGAPTYGQPSGHISQNPYPNINVAHNHPNVQQNHFSLNVPSASPHYNINTITPSNHPVTNPNQSSTGQVFGPPKAASYSSSYQPNLGHPPNQQNQSLPATQQVQQQQQTPVSQTPSNASNISSGSDASTEKPQSNGTAEEKTNVETQGNHVPPEKADKPSDPQVTPQTEKPAEKPKAPTVQETPKPAAPPEPVKLAEESITATTPPLSVPETDPLAIDTPSLPQESSEPSQSPVKSVESIESSSANQESERTDSSPSVEPDVGKEEESNVNKDSKEEGESTKVNEVTALAVGDKTDQVRGSAQKESPTKTAPAVRAPRKAKTPKPEEKVVRAEPKALQKSPSGIKTKRQRTRTQHYQSPLPEIEIITKISSSSPRTRGNDEKLIYFYKNEFLAVRNAEGGFYLCQAVQNIYKSSSKIKIRWLSQDKNDKSGEIYTPDFYDQTDFDCILTSLALVRVDKGKYRLTKKEKERTDNILKRCLAVEKGEIVSPSLSEEHPDGLDISLFKDEEQLKKKKRQGTKRKARARSASAPKKETTTKKSPEASKVRKVETKAAAKKIAATPAAAVKKPVVAKKVEAPKKAVASRAAKGRRKVETKTSPIVDQKKAKVLAKIGRKSAVTSSMTRSQNTASQGVKSVKAVPSTSKAASSSKSSKTTRKTKRSTWK